jgi:hypothetical protein
VNVAPFLVAMIATTPPMRASAKYGSFSIGNKFRR